MTINIYDFIAMRPTSIKKGSGGSALGGCSATSGLPGRAATHEERVVDALNYPFSAGFSRVDVSELSMTFENPEQAETNFTPGTKLTGTGSDALVIAWAAKGNGAVGATLTLSNVRIISCLPEIEGDTQKRVVIVKANTTDGTTSPVSISFA